MFEALFEVLFDDIPEDPPPPLTWPPGHGVIPGLGWIYGWPHR